MSSFKCLLCSNTVINVNNQIDLKEEVDGKKSILKTICELYNVDLLDPLTSSNKTEFYNEKWEMACSLCISLLKESDVLLEEIQKLKRKLEEVKVKIKGVVENQINFLPENKKRGRGRPSKNDVLNNKSKEFANYILQVIDSNKNKANKQEPEEPEFENDLSESESVLEVEGATAMDYDHDHSSDQESNSETDFEDNDLNFGSEEEDLKVKIYSISDIPLKKDLNYADKFKDNDEPIKDNQIFNKIEKVEELTLEENKKLNRYWCEKCEIGFKHNRPYEKHMYRAHHTKLYSCPRPCCKSKFTNSNEIARHLKRKHSDILIEPKTYSCYICSKSFLKKMKLRDHLATHTFECTEPGCNEKYNNEELFKKHLLIHDPNFVPFFCEICSKSFNYEAEFKKHQKVVHKIKVQKTRKTRKTKKFSCQECDYETTTDQNLKNHIMSQHKNEKEYICQEQECGASYNLYSSLLGHMDSHNPILYKCNICEISISKLKNYNRHMLRHENPEIAKPFKCQMCKKTFSDNYKLEAHTSLHENNKTICCSLCPAKFTHKYYLTMHMICVHKQKKRIFLKRQNSVKNSLNRKKLAESETNEIFKCTHENCPKEFKNNIFFHRHLKDAHSLPLTCDICQKTYKNKLGLKNHKLVVHEDTAKYICPECGYKTNILQNYNMHIAIHSTTRQFICEACGKDFKTLESLKSHSQFHTTTNKYKCDICNKRFSQKIVFKVHMKRHEGKEFKCSKCFKDFESKYKLEAHETQHGDERPEICNYCQKTFTHKMYLYSHLYGVHKIRASKYGQSLVSK